MWYNLFEKFYLCLCFSSRSWVSLWYCQQSYLDIWRVPYLLPLPLNGRDRIRCISSTKRLLSHSLSISISISLSLSLSLSLSPSLSLYLYLSLSLSLSLSLRFLILYVLTEPFTVVYLFLCHYLIYISFTGVPFYRYYRRYWFPLLLCQLIVIWFSTPILI